MPAGNGYRMLALKNVPDVGLMSMGAVGSAVSDVQLRLVSMGYWLPGVNGVFDANMQQAAIPVGRAAQIASIADPMAAQFGTTTGNSTTTSQTQVPMWQQILGGVLAGAGTAAQIASDARVKENTEEVGALHDRLSQREFEVMRGIASGESVGEIAERMHLSAKTVSTYRARLLDKMGMATNSELTRYALQNGLV